MPIKLDPEELETEMKNVCAILASRWGEEECNRNNNMRCVCVGKTSKRDV